MKMAHWTVKVCGSVAQKVDMQAGPSNTDNDVFATWRPVDGQKSFNLPDRIQNRDKIYFRAVTPGKGQTDLCVQYDGNTVRKLSFDGGNEDADDISKDDNDDCPC
jgi:hypothetical protein